MINAYTEIKIAAVLEAHERHIFFKRMVPFCRAKLGP